MFFYANIPQTLVDSVVANFFFTAKIFLHYVFGFLKKISFGMSEKNSIHKKNWSTWSNIYFGEHFFLSFFYVIFILLYDC